MCVGKKKNNEQETVNNELRKSGMENIWLVFEAQKTKLRVKRYTLLRKLSIIQDALQK